MAGSYRPRPIEKKPCTQCGIYFESRHKRAIYCCSSCRTLAYNSRHQYKQDKASKKLPGNLELSAQNLAVTALGSAAGSAAVATANYLANDKPATNSILERLSELEIEIKRGNKMAQTAAQFQIDFINAVRKSDSNLDYNFNEVRKISLKKLS